MSNYKFVPHTSTLSSIADAISELQSLAEECREIVDNAPEGLSETQRIQTLDETAGYLEDVNEPDIPEGADDLAISYSEAVPTRKGRSPSRSTRRDNALAIIGAAVEALEAKVEELREEANDARGEDDDSDEGDVADAKADSFDELKTELEEIVSNVESCEFPGMFG